MQKCKDKKCLACGNIYSPTSRNQKWCKSCKESGYKGKPPLCQCGCGQEVNWDNRRSGWSLFKQGHATKEFSEKLKKEGKKHFNTNNPCPWKGRRKYKVLCTNCGKISKTSHKDKKYCNAACYREHYRGPKHPYWTGGKLNGGYKFVQDNQGKLRREHVVVVEKSIGRKLSNTEVVHHIDQKRDNNDLNNLFLFHCSNCHMHHHKTGRKLEYIYKDIHANGTIAYKYPGR